MEASEKKELEIKILEELLEDIKGMHLEYIPEHIKEQISILKHGV